MKFFILFVLFSFLHSFLSLSIFNIQVSFFAGVSVSLHEDDDDLLSEISTTKICEKRREMSTLRSPLDARIYKTNLQLSQPRDE